MEEKKLTRRLAEIAENLHRKELTRLERSKLVAEWVELVGGEKPVQVAQVSGGRGIEGGDSKAARDLGLSRYDVRRSKKVAGLTDEAVEAAKELGLDDNMAAIGREIAAEVEKIFEAKINPETIRSRARRKARSNDQDGENPRQSTVSVDAVDAKPDPVAEVNANAGCCRVTPAHPC